MKRKGKNLSEKQRQGLIRLYHELAIERAIERASIPLTDEEKQIRVEKIFREEELRNKKAKLSILLAGVAVAATIMAGVNLWLHKPRIAPVVLSGELNQTRHGKTVSDGRVKPDDILYIRHTPVRIDGGDSIEHILMPGSIVRVYDADAGLLPRWHVAIEEGAIGIQSENHAKNVRWESEFATYQIAGTTAVLTTGQNEKLEVLSGKVLVTDHFGYALPVSGGEFAYAANLPDGPLPISAVDLRKLRKRLERIRQGASDLTVPPGTDSALWEIWLKKDGERIPVYGRIVFDGIYCTIFTKTETLRVRRADILDMRLLGR